MIHMQVLQTLVLLSYTDIEHCSSDSYMYVYLSQVKKQLKRFLYDIRPFISFASLSKRPIKACNYYAMN